MSPMTRLRATMPGHIPNSLMAKYYSQRSGTEGASVIITEATNISDTAGGYYAEPGIYTQKQEDGWKKIINLRVVNDSRSLWFIKFFILYPVASDVATDFWCFLKWDILEP